MLAKANSYYEFCLFQSPFGQLCNYEWKRGVWNLTQMSCNGLEERVRFVGSYDEYECAIQISEAMEDDIGSWTCELESYVLGVGRGSGKIRRGEISVTVNLPTTTTTTTTTTTQKHETRVISNTYSNRNIKSVLALRPRDKLVPNLPNLPTLPASKILFNLGFAKVLPVAVSFVFITVFLILFTILVVVHKRKNMRSVEALPKASDVGDKEVANDAEDPVRAEQMKFMRTVFPHIMKFPNDDPGLNL